MKKGFLDKRTAWQCCLHPLQNSNGMALLIVVSIISLLVALTLQFNKSMRHHALVSGYQRDGVQSRVMAESGAALATALLQLDGRENSYDTFFDAWANLAEEDLSVLFANGSLEVVIEDLDGRFPINSLFVDWKKLAGKKEREAAQKKEQALRNIFWRLLRSKPFSLEDGKAREIIDSLVDWLDGNDGDAEQEYGAESSYYLSLDPPYTARNGPVRFVEELLMVKGVTRELLYGDGERQALAPLLTVQETEGKININTADPLILQALHEEMSVELAETLQNFRDIEENKELLSGILWYNNIPSFPGDIKIESEVITTQSNHFMVSVQAQHAEVKKNLHAFMRRDKGRVTLLGWRVD